MKPKDWLIQIDMSNTEENYSKSNRGEELLCQKELKEVWHPTGHLFIARMRQICFNTVDLNRQELYTFICI